MMQARSCIARVQYLLLPLPHYSFYSIVHESGMSALSDQSGNVKRDGKASTIHECKAEGKPKYEQQRDVKECKTRPFDDG